MEKLKKNIKLQDLKAGMILANPIKHGDTTLVEKGIPLTDLLLNKLKYTYVYDNIDVYYELEEYISEELIKAEEEFVKMTFELENLFDKLDKLKSADMAEIRKFTLRIKKSLYFTDSIVKNIVLYGSGKDSVYRHGVNVASLSLILGKWIGLDDAQLNLLAYAGVLHDFGKTKIDKNILNKK